MSMRLGREQKEIIWIQQPVGPPPTWIGIGIKCSVNWLVGKVGELGKQTPTGFWNKEHQLAGR